MRPKPTSPTVAPVSSRPRSCSFPSFNHLSAARQRVGLCDSPCGCQHQRDRELRGGVRQDVRRVRGSDASRADRLDVDVVVADPEVGDDLQRAAGRVEELAVDGGGGVGHDRRGAGSVLAQPARLGPVAAGLDDEPFCLRSSRPAAQASGRPRPLSDGGRARPATGSERRSEKDVHSSWI